MERILKRVICVILILIMALTMLGCNFKGYDWVDTNYHFERAIILMPDGSVKEVEIRQWADAEGEQLTITAKDGTRYLVSSYNCVLIEEP